MLLFIAQYNGVSVEYLVDSGNTHSFAKLEIVARIRCMTAAAPGLFITLVDENNVLLVT